MDPDKLSISPATERDLKEIAVLVNSAYRGDTSRQGWTTEADFLDGQRTDAESLAEELARQARTILCLRSAPDPSIIGCVALDRFNDEKGMGHYLGMLTIKPNLQAHGLGKFLLHQAENFAKGAGASRITMSVIHLRDSLMAWYERQGYVRTGETKPFPHGQPKFGLPKREDLHFILFEKRL